jgi:hypothetical protein
MIGLSRKTVRTMAASLAGIAVLGGCISYTKETSTERAVPVVASAPSTNRVVNYTEGRYELYGDGTTRAPYYWVWIPSGSITTPPPPPAIPVR